jgi:hypothetical protein
LGFKLSKLTVSPPSPNKLKLMKAAAVLSIK